ncbi:hypothetical protein VTI74DRAFT_522 [Chaetomium olivicolor]
MARPAANAAVRERCRCSTPQELERMNVIKALTAAEYSRRQFILSFASSRDLELLIPGKKADAVKAAEQWTAAMLSENGRDAVDAQVFKYAVDARLWSRHVGPDIEFPFAFMQGQTVGSIFSQTDRKWTKSDGFVDSHEIDVGDGEVLDLTTSTSSSSADSPESKRSHSPQTPRKRSTKNREPAKGDPTKRWSLPLNIIEDGKVPKEKGSLLNRLSRSWSRRKTRES